MPTGYWHHDRWNDVRWIYAGGRGADLCEQMPDVFPVFGGVGTVLDRKNTL
jgi:hypothetical protein